MQAVLDIAMPPSSPLAAAELFHRSHLSAVTEALKQPEIDALAIVLPGAGPDHDDWRRALARDLARANSPKRVNIVGADTERLRREMLAYLRDAPGVTGQYLAAHE